MRQRADPSHPICYLCCSAPRSPSNSDETGQVRSIRLSTREYGIRHGIWLSGPGTPQFSVSGCPDILAAERQARHLLRRCTIEQLNYSKIQAAAGQDDDAWKRQTLALIETNPRQATESSAQALFQAAAYPEAITAATAACTRAAGFRR